MSSVVQPGSAERLAESVARDGGRCIWCGRPFSRLIQPTRDHLIPRVKGGPSWSENEAAACRRCNAQRGHRSPVDWLHDCESRGWAPDRGLLVTKLRDLARAIDERGGQRRARAYLAGQLRRLD